MNYRTLGRTGIKVSEIAFGAGPVPALMTTDGRNITQHTTIQRALEQGINWFDTAATYGDGESERNLGIVLRDLTPSQPIHLATKVRLMPGDLGAIPEAIRRSIQGSLRRLQRERVTLLQLHNAITRKREEEPTSITPADVLGSDGVLGTFERLKQEGLVQHLGLTGLGQPEALAEVIRTGAFDTIQVCYNLLNPSAGWRMPSDFGETDYGNIIAIGAQQGMGIFAIRTLAGGALAGNPPSTHTLSTRFFPLDLYERDRERAEALADQLPDGLTVKEAAIRFVFSHPDITAAIVGFSAPEQVDEAVQFCESGVVETNWDASSLTPRFR